jgi:hypothetical protein
MDLRKVFAAFLFLLACSIAWGQIGAVESLGRQSFGAGTVVPTDKGPRRVKIGDVISVNGGPDIVIAADTQLSLKNGAIVVFKDTGAVAKLPPAPVEVDVYPLAVFTYSGALGNEGGTVSFNGELFALNAPLISGKLESIELGGFYFLERESRDIYQFHLRLHATPEWGTQIAYLNTSNGHAPAITTFLLYDLTSARMAKSSRLPWALELGAGTYWNIGKDLRASEGTGDNVNFTEVPRSTVNFTYYLNASVALSKKVSLSASQWYIRDRNGELNRFTLGLGFRF